MEWRKRCPSTLTHTKEHAPYIPDEQDICNSCLLDSVGLLPKGKLMPACVDPLGMMTVYDEDDVLEALRNR